MNLKLILNSFLKKDVELFNSIETYVARGYLNVSTLWGVGFRGKAPGTLASLIVVIVSFIIKKISFFVGYDNVGSFIILLLFMLFLVFGFNSVSHTLNGLKDVELAGKVNDPSFIVVDEVVGQLIPLLIISNSFIEHLIVFALFRFFDITKISFVATAERAFKGETGVILDDVVAGIFTMFVFAILKILFL